MVALNRSSMVNTVSLKLIGSCAHYQHYRYCLPWEARDLIERAIVQVNFYVPYFLMQKKDLDALETLTRISQKVRSQLDPGYLEPLGEGSFGQVFQAKKDGRPVAVKILKNITNRNQIKYFEREVDMLRLVNNMPLVLITVLGAVINFGRISDSRGLLLCSVMDFVLTSELM